MTRAPSRRQWLRLSLGLAGAAALPGAGRAQALQWRERVWLGFGTTLWMRAAHANAAMADAALDAALAATRHVERQMSLFDPQSALCQLNRDGALRDPHPDLVAVLTLARRVAQRSQGAFDVSVQPLWATWARAHAEGRSPTRGELNTARRQVDWRAVHIEPERITLRKPGMALTLNGIAQGYAADLAQAALRSRGIEHALLNTGEWSTLGQGPDGQAWTLGIADPHAAGALIARLSGESRAVATSSDAHTSFSADHRHHHILDPRTGQSPGELSSVTVVADSGALADALTKVVFMGGWNHAIGLALEHRVDVLVVDKRGRWQASAGLQLT